MSAAITPLAALQYRAAGTVMPTTFADGRYVVVDSLGEGGRKRAYRARDTRLGREVAFALISTEGLDSVGRQRLRREAQAMARLGDHPHVVTVFDIGEISRSCSWAMT